MKKNVFMLFLLFFCISVVHAEECSQCVVNKHGVEIPIAQYVALIEMGYSEEYLYNIPQDTYDTFGTIEKIDAVVSEKYYRETFVVNGENKFTIIEEIKKFEYDAEIPINERLIISNPRYSVNSSVSTSHETTYKKLVASIIKTSVTEPNRRSIISSLDWKKVPSTRSFDIYASRVVGGVIVLNSQSGQMIQERYTFDENCGYNGHETTSYSVPYDVSGWNKLSSGLGYSGVGYTAKLDTSSTVCVHDYGTFIAPITGYTSTLSYNATTTGNSNALTIYVSYQHAQSNVDFYDVYNSYTFSNNGLGNVIYFSNGTIRSKYDGMAGISLTY